MAYSADDSNAPRNRPRPPGADHAPNDLERVIRDRISRRLGGRVHNLDVRVAGGEVRLAGRCSTYYAKQLALHATLGVLEDERVSNAIEVAPFGYPASVGGSPGRS